MLGTEGDPSSGAFDPHRMFRLGWVQQTTPTMDVACANRSEGTQVEVQTSGCKSAGGPIERALKALWRSLLIAIKAG